MEFRVDTRTCDLSDLRRCPGIDPDTCSCIRNVTIPEADWAEQKFTCADFNGGPPALGTNGTFWIQATSEKDTSVIYFEGALELPGARFNATGPGGENVAANMFLNLYTCNTNPCTGPGTLLQQIVFHSSCSQELYLLDIFGSFQLIEFETRGQGVIGFAINPIVDFSIELDAASIGGTLELEFMSIVVLSRVPGLLPPQIFSVDVAGTSIPPDFVVDEQIQLIPGQPFNVITTIGGTLNGIGCFDVSESIVQCNATVNPGGGDDGGTGTSKSKNNRLLLDKGRDAVKGRRSFV